MGCVIVERTLRYRPLVQHIGQGGTRTSDAALDGPHGTAADIGSLFVGEAASTHEQQCLAALRW